MSETQTELPGAKVQAPDDVDTKVATGVGVYDVTLQRFVGPVHRGSGAAKATKEHADGLDDSHEYVTRRV